MKRLGVIGGLGPAASAYFYELVIRMTQAETDQEHLDMILISRPSIPDRTNYILGKSGENPVGPMVGAGKQLAGLKVDYIAIPCITAHYFYEELEKEIKVPIVHAVRETAWYCRNHGILRAGLLATDGTIQSNLFQKELENCGIQTILPDSEHQGMVMDLIYKDVKAGQPVEWDKFRSVSEQLRREGAEVMILGCSELSLLKRDCEIGPGCLDTMEVLAMRSIQLCGAKLKKEYEAGLVRVSSDSYVR